MFHRLDSCSGYSTNVICSITAPLKPVNLTSGAAKRAVKITKERPVREEAMVPFFFSSYLCALWLSSLEFPSASSITAAVLLYCPRNFS
jgi:hypothetical protein